MKLIQQKPGDNTCVGCVAAMLSETTLGGFRSAMWGVHDGERARPPWTDLDAYTYLCMEGYTMGTGHQFVPPQPLGSTLFAGADVDLQDKLAYIVTFNDNGLRHIVAWDGHKVLDPSVSSYVVARDLEDYEIVEIFIVTKMEMGG